MTLSFFPPHLTAFTAIDCQTAFYKTQGTPETEAAARRIDDMVPALHGKGVMVLGVFSKASSVAHSSLLPALKQYGVNFPKSHESVVQGSDVLARLKKSYRPFIVIGGFHLTTCVLASALNLREAGFTVALATDVSGEGQRGRNLSKQALRAKVGAAHARLENAGIRVAPLRVILAL